MFEQSYKDGSFAGEKSRSWRLIGVRIGILVAIAVIGLGIKGYMKWSEVALHNKLMERHAQASAYYDPNVFKNDDGVYAIHYGFSVNGKTYYGHVYSKTLPTNAEGVIYYNPDDPEEHELQPF